MTTKIVLRISYGNTQGIISESFALQKLLARWVPSLLASEQVLMKLQARFYDKWKTNLSCIVAWNETWVHHCMPKLNQARVLHCCLTFNAAYCFDLFCKVELAYHQRRDHCKRDVILLHDNACPHIIAVTRAKLYEMNWTALDHLHYSPDLSPCDFHLFGLLKEALGG
ncbi:hypothetical protein J437_LFUL018528 [Ladona fulva]|uniref:Transposase n=1 Tax=Ladona fulva TaxID=123851 RepID=A0A8K0KR29_LADFU|nr:hypothetical protein J437_LFUL018528 [Ladona fulva]